MIRTNRMVSGDRNATRQVFLAMTTLWCGAILLAPAAALESVYAFFSLICHQLPDRTWHIDGHPLAVCIRCTSIYGGFLVALILGVPA